MVKKLLVLACFIPMLALVSTSVASSIDPDLIGWWPLSEGSGDLVADHAGSGNHGTIQNVDSGGQGLGGSVWFNDPNRGTVLSFNGDDNGGAFVAFNQKLPSMTMGSGFTWAFWAKQQGDGSGGNDIIVGNRFGGTGDRQWIKFTPTKGEYVNQIHVGTIDYDNVPADVWVHMVFVKDRNRLIHYRNGELSATSTITDSLDEIPFYLGGGERGERWAGWLSDVYLYTRAVTQEEVLLLMEGLTPEHATAPSPEDEKTDVLSDVTLAWKPGIFAETHDLYFGMDFEDINAAGTDSPLLIGSSLDINSFDLDGLEFGQTYFWRVDEVNAPADSKVYKGEIWSFTVEPIARLVDATTISATASSQYEESGPEKTIDRSGLDANDLHSSKTSHMWLSDTSEPGFAWIQYEFDKPCQLYQMLVWNFNGDSMIRIFGLKDVTVEYSMDGVEWSQINEVFAQAPGKPGYAYNTTVEFGGVAAKIVKIVANSNWETGTGFNKFGLSEVQFLQIPVSAREPSPQSGATDIAVDATLRWIAGREAAKHDVYTGTDEQAVAEGTAPMETVTETVFSPTLDLSTTYYWRVDEVNEAETPSIWDGPVWKLTTQPYISVDDFETYTDTWGQIVFQTWIDGFGWEDPDGNSVEGNGSGAAVGYWPPPTIEDVNVYDGVQSMPLTYGIEGKTLSKTTSTWPSLPVNQHGIKTLSLQFYGAENNVPGQLFIEINGSKVADYPGAQDDMKLAVWHPWTIDLTTAGIARIESLTIGITGGNGKIYIDAIRLNP